MAFKEMARTVAEAAKDTGRKFMGQGREVAFKNAVHERMKRTGISEREAQTEELDDRFASLSSGRLDKDGVFDIDSNEWQNVQAGFHEIFGKKRMKEFRVDADDATVAREIRVPTRPPGAVERKNTERWFGSKYNKLLPNSRVVGDVAHNGAVTRDLVARFRAELAMGGDITKLTKEMGADVGMMMRQQERIERHEKGFVNELKYKKSVADFKKSGKESLKAMLLGEPAKFAWSLLKSLKYGPLGFFPAVTAGFRLVGMEAYHGLKIAKKGLGAASAGLEARRTKTL